MEDGSPERLAQAARLLGGADALAARLALIPGSYWAARFERARARLEASLGEEPLGDLLAEGAALLLPDLLALAAEWPEPSGDQPR